MILLRLHAGRSAGVSLLLGLLAFHAGPVVHGQDGAGRGVDDDFTVATWNLEWFYDEFPGDNYSKLAREQTAPDRGDWNWKRDVVADAIGRLQPDVLALQEIEGQRVLHYLSQALGRLGSAPYRIGFVEGSDYHTEQDVGFLVRRGSDITRIARYEQSRSMFESDRFHNVAKHAEIVVDVPVGDRVEPVTILTLHLRAREEAVESRTRQARLVHAWLRDRIAAGENIIVLGDTNSEVTDLPPPEGSDLAALAGLDTPDGDDDLVDLHRYLDPADRRTHLLDGKQYDRILVSRSLIEDAPGREDLVFSTIAVRRDLAVRNGIDSSETHWDKYWETHPGDRDTSDHWPVVATFSVK
jgi:endonuclease/exonuclease/phosphatase family metal-dependent hydrolase